MTDVLVGGVFDSSRSRFAVTVGNLLADLVVLGATSWYSSKG